MRWFHGSLMAAGLVSLAACGGGASVTATQGQPMTATINTSSGAEAAAMANGQSSQFQQPPMQTSAPQTQWLPPGGAAAQPPQQQNTVPNVVVAPPGMASQPGFDAEHPVMRCGPRDSYYYVSTEFRCADGSNPLNGQLMLGARSRVGNVGANSTGHIIDLYQINCPEGPRRVFVDMYGCPQNQGP